MLNVYGGQPQKQSRTKWERLDYLMIDNRTATGGNRDFSMKSRKMSAYMKSKGTMNAVKMIDLGGIAITVVCRKWNLSEVCGAKHTHRRIKMFHYWPWLFPIVKSINHFIFWLGMVKTFSPYLTRRMKSVILIKKKDNYWNWTCEVSMLKGGKGETARVSPPILSFAFFLRKLIF